VGGGTGGCQEGAGDGGASVGGGTEGGGEGEGGRGGEGGDGGCACAICFEDTPADRCGHPALLPHVLLQLHQKMGRGCGECTHVQTTLVPPCLAQPGVIVFVCRGEPACIMPYVHTPTASGCFMCPRALVLLCWCVLCAQATLVPSCPLCKMPFEHITMKHKGKLKRNATTTHGASSNNTTSDNTTSTSVHAQPSDRRCTGQPGAQGGPGLAGGPVNRCRGHRGSGSGWGRGRC